MKALVISHALCGEVIRYLQSCLPYEGCGLLIGRGQYVTRIINIRNVAQNQRYNYSMDGGALASALSGIESADEDWVGVFHSHVGSVPIPSPTDIDGARIQTAGMVHLIVGFVGDTVQLGAWCIEGNGRVHRVELLEHERDLMSYTVESRALSPYERGLLVMVALLAVVILVFVAVMLLPAAPNLN